MDLETENRLAALLMEEARRLRVQAEKEGVHVYLQQPNVRGRPNARFLTATVLGVQQANRAVEVGEMWRAREKELKLEAKLKSRVKDKDMRRGRKHQESSLQEGSTPRNSATYCSSSRNAHEDCYSSDDNGGLRDEEVEEFLHSRAKRGRGDIGSRMDEPGPYISSTSSGHQLMESTDTRTSKEWERRILGPEKPSFLKPHEPPDEVSVVVKRSKKQLRAKEEMRSRKEEWARKEKSSSKHHHHKSGRRD